MSKRHMQMANKNMLNMLPDKMLNIREIKTMRNSTPTRMSMIKKPENNEYW